MDLRNSHRRYRSVISSALNTAVAAAREGQRDKEWCSEHLLKDSSPVTDKISKISASLLLDLIPNYYEKSHFWSNLRLLMQEVPHVKEQNLHIGSIRERNRNFHVYANSPGKPSH